MAFHTLSFFAAILTASSFVQAAVEPLPLRVLSFNLRYINSEDKGERTWLARRDQASQVIREDHPDLVGVQEAFRVMLDDIAVRAPGYGEIGFGREDGKMKGEYAAILYRKDRFNVLESGTFWLSDTPEIPGSATWKNRVTRICTWAKVEARESKRVFYFYNTHFDHESQEAREKSVELILRHLSERKQPAPVIITGDFNAAEDNPAILRMKAAPLNLVDSWRALHPSAGPAESGTLSMFTGEKESAKIDYIFVEPRTRLIDAEIIHRNQNGNYPSDHYPIRATVEFPGE